MERLKDARVELGAELAIIFIQVRDARLVLNDVNQDGEKWIG